MFTAVLSFFKGSLNWILVLFVSSAVSLMFGYFKGKESCNQAALKAQLADVQKSISEANEQNMKNLQDFMTLNNKDQKILDSLKPMEDRLKKSLQSNPVYISKECTLSHDEIKMLNDIQKGLKK